MSRRRSAQSHNSTPALEQRMLLAGNVTVRAVSSPEGPDIVITGDSSANSITITQTSTDVYTVKGLSTKINGVTGGTFQFRFDQFDDLRIAMSGGNDYLEIRGDSTSAIGDLDITDALVIDMGTGNDRVNLRFLEVKGNLNVKMGSGNDKFNIRDSKVDGIQTLDGGSGTDDINALNIQDVANPSHSLISFKPVTRLALWY